MHFSLKNLCVEIQTGGLKNSPLNYINQGIPLKIRYVRANQVPYMSKTISKAIVVRSRLKNKYMKNTSKGN